MQLFYNLITVVAVSAIIQTFVSMIVPGGKLTGIINASMGIIISFEIVVQTIALVKSILP